MSDSEDDFMSDKFLAGTEEVRPGKSVCVLFFLFLFRICLTFIDFAGLAKTNHQRRIMKIENERAEAEAERVRLLKLKKPVSFEAANLLAKVMFQTAYLFFSDRVLLILTTFPIEIKYET